MCKAAPTMSSTAPGPWGACSSRPPASFDVAGGDRFINTTFDNDGLVDLAGGDLSFNGSSLDTHAGHFAIAAAATFSANATMALSSAGIIDGAGTLRLVGGTLTVPDGATYDPGTSDHPGGTLAINGTAPATTLDNVVLRGGTLTGSRDRTIGTLDARSGTLSGANTTTVTGSFAKTTGGGLNLSVLTFVPTVDSSWSDGTICINDAATFQLDDTLDVQSGADNVQHCSGTVGRLVISSTGVFDVAGGDRFINTTFDNDGLVDLASGDLSFSGSSLDTHAGHFAIGAAASFVPNATMALSSAGIIDGAGTLRMVGGTLTVPDGATYDPGISDLTGGTVTVNGTAPATTLDTVILRGGTLTGSRNRTIGTLDARNGTLSGANTTTVATSFTKTTGGNLTLSQATVVPDIDMTWEQGTICVNDAALLRLPHTFTIGDAAGNIQHCSGVIGQVDVTTTGRIERATAGSTSFSVPVHNQGEVAIASGQTLTFTDFQNETGGTLSGAGTAGGPITNAGGTVSPDGGTFTLSGTLTQSSGATDVGGAETLAISGAHGQSGGSTAIADGGTLSAASHALSGGTTRVTGTLGGPVTLTGGAVLDGTGQVSGNLTNTAGDVRPGTSPGTLAIGGDYTQGAGGTLRVEIDGATSALFDHLAVTGAATLNGTLAIVQGAGFDPASSDTFQVVTSASRTGTFSSVTGTALSGDRSYSVVYPGGPAFGALVVIDLPAAPTPGVPQIVGTMAVGQSVTCTEGTWGGSPSFTYEWLRDGTPIGGATARDYTIVGADAAHDLSCRVTGSNSGGSEQATSATRSVPAVAPQNTALPSLSGTDTLTCDPGTWTGAPPPTFTFEWLRDGQVIPGAGGSTYTLTDADAGHVIRCRVTGTNAGGSDTATSDGFDVPAVAPDNTGLPTITGTGTLTCDPGTWTGAPAPTFTFEWLRTDVVIPGATGSTYTLTDADAGHMIRCRVTGTNSGGSDTATSDRFNAPAVAPDNTSRPTITGTDTLTCDPGTWTGAPAPTFTFAWLRDGVVIPGATGSTYTLTSADAGHTITCRVTGANLGGSDSATSDGVAVPAPSPTPTPTPTPTATPTPTPKPKPKPKPQQPAILTATPQQVATAFGLPAATRCISKRRFPIRLREPRGIKIRRAKITFNGKAMKVRKRAGRFRALIDLRGLAKGRFTIVIRVTTTAGDNVTGKRKYRTCAKRRRGGGGRL